MVYNTIVHPPYVCILKILSSNWGFQESCIVCLVETTLIYPRYGDPQEGRGYVAILISPFLLPGRNIVKPNVRFAKDVPALQPML